MIESPDVVEIILVLFALSIIVFPAIWGYRAGAKRKIGSIGGLLLGLFFNVFGVLIVYCVKRKQAKNFYNFLEQPAVNELLKYKKLLKNGVISEAEYNRHKSNILNAKTEIV